MFATVTEDRVCSLPHLVIDQQLHGVVPPLDEHQLVGLSGRRVGKRRPHPGPDARPDPQAQGQGEDLLQQRPLQAPVHVVASHGEADLEGVGTRWFPLAESCLGEKRRSG